MSTMRSKYSDRAISHFPAHRRSQTHIYRQMVSVPVVQLYSWIERQLYYSRAIVKQNQRSQLLRAAEHFHLVNPHQLILRFSDLTTTIAQSTSLNGIIRHMYFAGSSHPTGSTVAARSGALKVSFTSSVGRFRKISSR